MTLVTALAGFWRFQAYQSARARPRGSGELEMLYSSQVLYERRLAALSDSTQAAALAVGYVDALRPCYEWEGYHDCPEREAVFAADYQRAHPDGPFSAYLPLLEAHRWLCAAEGYDGEKRPDGAARSRAAHEQALAGARRSTNILVRLAAEELAARGRCFPQR